MIQNTKLWDSVYKTDPAHTKRFTKGGGFSGTAIKPFWLIKRATETFGPCGIGWGWEEIENKMVAGIWCSKVQLWYKFNPVVVSQSSIEPVTGYDVGKIEQWGQTVMEGKNKNGDFVDEEAPKKAVTDAVTKCLSYLGFAGDVHMGLFDDSKYVQDTEQEFKKEETARNRNERWLFIRDSLIGAEEFIELQNLWTNHLKDINDFKKIDPELYSQLVRVKDDRKMELATAAGHSPDFNKTK